jgi:hypothetical protein
MDADGARPAVTGSNRCRGARSGWIRRRGEGAAAEALAQQRAELSSARRASALALEDRIEAYLRRAMEAERLAAGGGEQFRRDMIDLAMQWRDLARQLAELAAADAPPRR